MPERVTYTHVGSFIRKRREEKEWSLTELAHRADVSRSYLSQIEHGKSAPTQEIILRIAAALDALPSELLGEPTTEMRIPESLRMFAEQQGLGSADVQMLTQIQYRGRRPGTVEEWKAIYGAIRGIVGED